MIVAFVGFLIVKAVATPASWNHHDWYRGNSPIEIAALPLVYGGNESCQDCHKYEHDTLLEFKHKTLSCESCHGALADHIEENEKIMSAEVDESAWQCLNCHSKQINRPKEFPQFTKNVEWHEAFEKGMACVACHDAHDPGL
jgi:predicted CxxxxCH...CXXCH cytochrome family protein